jgi:hypothetical protein
LIEVIFATAFFSKVACALSSFKFNFIARAFIDVVLWVVYWRYAFISASTNFGHGGV